MSYGQRPSVSRNLRNHTFPTQDEAARRKSKLPDPFTYVIQNGVLNRTGEYYVGLKALNWLNIYAKLGYTPSLNYTLRIFETKCKFWDDDLKIWSSKGCKVCCNVKLILYESTDQLGQINLICLLDTHLNGSPFLQ